MLGGVGAGAGLSGQSPATRLTVVFIIFRNSPDCFHPLTNSLDYQLYISVFGSIRFRFGLHGHGTVIATTVS